MKAPHDELMQSLTDIKQIGDGINRRLDTLNGSVAKHEARFGSQDVLNAQVTLSQSQIVKDLQELRTTSSETINFRLKAQGSIETFKWLIGLIGIGTLATAIKIFTQ